jgi:ATP-dependent Clp protease ATP-binding subunit ClpA
MPFEKFTVKARQVVVTAQEEARLLKHNYIGTEHILLGLLDAPDSMAAKVLHQLGYNKETAQVDIAAVVKPGTAELSGHIPFTPRAKKTLELALREALQLHHTYIGTEHVSTASALAGGAPVGSHHLLEAMLRAENSMAARVLRELGVDPDAVAAKIDELDPETTTDANPEEAAARKMEIRLVDDEVHLILRDPATVTIAKKVTELSNGPIQGVGPVAGMFVPLWRSTNQLLLQIQRVLEPEPEEEGGSAASKVATAVRTVLAPRFRR